MGQKKGLYTNIRANKIKSIILVFLMPFIVYFTIYILSFIFAFLSLVNDKSNFSDLQEKYLSSGVLEYTEDGHILQTEKLKTFTEEQLYVYDEEGNLKNFNTINRFLNLTKNDYEELINKDEFEYGLKAGFYWCNNVMLVLFPLLLIYNIISFFSYKKIIFSFAGAKPLERKENPEIYNIVENLCISRGLPTPKIGIIEESGMNAFATGISPENSWIVFTRGLINKLNKNEIEAVAGHELTHIINRDVLLMTVCITFIGSIYTIGHILYRIGISLKPDKKEKGVKFLFIISGLVFIILGSIILPLIKLAISRKQEYLADAGSVELTKNKNAMITALEKISGNSILYNIKQKTIGDSFIASPFTKNWFKNILSTHPPIESRIDALKGY